MSWLSCGSFFFNTFDIASARGKRIGLGCKRLEHGLNKSENPVPKTTSALHRQEGC